MEVMIVLNNRMLITNQLGLLAQLARAPALHAGGQRFESVILHWLVYFYTRCRDKQTKFIDILELIEVVNHKEFNIRVR